MHENEVQNSLSRCIRKLPVGNTVHAGTFEALHFSGIRCLTQGCEHFPSVGIESSGFLWHLMLLSADNRLNHLLPRKYFCLLPPCALHLHSDIDSARRENSFPFIFFCSLVVMTLLRLRDCESHWGCTWRIAPKGIQKIFVCAAPLIVTQCGKHFFVMNLVRLYGL